MSYDAGDFKQGFYSSCPGTLGSKIRLNWQMDQVNQVLDLCKIIILGPPNETNCFSTSYTASFAHEQTITFDLLRDTSKVIALPELAISPSSCNFSASWKVYDQASNEDLALLEPKTYEIIESAPELVLTHTFLDYEQRK